MDLRTHPDWSAVASIYGAHVKSTAEPWTAAGFRAAFDKYQADKPKNPADRTNAPAAATKKEGTTMKAETKTMTQAQTRDAFAKLARETNDPNVRAQAEHMVTRCEDRLDPKRAAVRAELDRKMGLVGRATITVQNGARHGMRAATPAEAEAELERRGAAGMGVR